MLPVSNDFLRTVQSSHERLLVAHVATPTATAGVLNTPVAFDISGGSSTAVLQNGQRYEASFDVTPDDTRTWADILLTPGAIFTLDVQIRTTGNTFESCRLFTGELSSAPSVSLYGDGFALTCQDQWQRLERCRYTSPFTTVAKQRWRLIGEAVTGAIPNISVIASPAASASHDGGVLVDKMRTDLIIDLANDSDPDYSVGFNAQGNFLIEPQPNIDLDTTVWTVSDGDAGTLIDFQQVKEVDKMYNTVVVRPGTATQTWGQVIVEITDTSHPRHKSKIGVVPYFQIAPTAAASGTALNVGILTLKRIIQQQTSGRVVSVDNPALEPGDVIECVMTTGPNQGETIPAIVTQIQRDLLAATMELQVQLQNIDTDIAEADDETGST